MADAEMDKIVKDGLTGFCLAPSFAMYVIRNVFGLNYFQIVLVR